MISSVLSFCRAAQMHLRELTLPLHYLCDLYDFTHLGSHFHLTEVANVHADMRDASSEKKQKNPLDIFYLPSLPYSPVTLWHCFTLRSGPERRVTQFKYLGCSVRLAFSLKFELFQAGRSLSLAQ